MPRAAGADASPSSTAVQQGEAAVVTAAPLVTRRLVHTATRCWASGPPRTRQATARGVGLPFSGEAPCARSAPGPGSNPTSPTQAPAAPLWAREQQEKRLLVDRGGPAPPSHGMAEGVGEPIPESERVPPKERRGLGRAAQLILVKLGHGERGPVSDKAVCPAS